MVLDLDLGSFFAALPHLAKTGRTVYLVDWLGMGGSDRIKVPNIKGQSVAGRDHGEIFFVDSLKFWMEQEHIHKATLVGHSLGGLLACLFAASEPSFIHRLVLAGPAGLGRVIKTSTSPRRSSWTEKLLDFMWTRNVTPQNLVRLMGETRGRELVKSAVSRRFFNHHQNGGWNANLLTDYLFEITRAPASGEFALGHFLSEPFQTRAILSRKPIENIVGQYTFPVDVIYGDHDWLRTESSMEHAREIGTLHVLQNAGHHLYLEQPVAFAKICAQ